MTGTEGWALKELSQHLIIAWRNSWMCCSLLHSVSPKYTQTPHKGSRNSIYIVSFTQTSLEQLAKRARQNNLFPYLNDKARFHIPKMLSKPKAWGGMILTSVQIWASNNKSCEYHRYKASASDISAWLHF